MGTSTGSNSHFPSLFDKAVFWWPGSHCAGYTSDYNEFPIIPSGVTVTNYGTWTKTDLGNNKGILNFDGSTNYLTLTNNDAWNFGSGGFTIAFWLKQTSRVLNNFLMGQPQYSGGWYGYGPMVIQINASGHVTIAFASASDSGWIALVTSNVVLPLDTWGFITFTRIGNLITIYYDSTPAGTTSTPVNIYNSADVFKIGGYYRTGDNEYFNGSIKDLLIYKGRALTLSELTLIMRKTHPLTGTGLLPGPYDYWRLS